LNATLIQTELNELHTGFTGKSNLTFSFKLPALLVFPLICKSVLLFFVRFIRCFLIDLRKKVVTLPKIAKALNYMIMMFIDRIKQLREQCQMPQRQLAAALEMDQATYCKIEKSERRARREHIIIIAELLKADQDELLSLWLADQLIEIVENEQKLAEKALNVAQKYVRK
jgi:transcriptional regulator with XRE-family HTH domain